MTVSTILRTRRLVAGATIALALIAVSLVPGKAFAGFTTCNTDPKIFLSNGVKVTITASITDVASNVQHIAYVVHGPAGITPTSIVYTGGSFAGTETVQYYADNLPNAYSTSTTVTATNTSDSVTAQSSVGSASSSGTTPSSGTATGLVGQSLLVHLTY